MVRDIWGKEILELYRKSISGISLDFIEELEELEDGFKAIENVNSIQIIDMRKIA